MDNTNELENTDLIAAIADAPIALSPSEINEFEIVRAICNTLDWLVKEPSDKRGKELRTKFLALYAKIRAANELVEDGITSVCLGEDSEGKAHYLSKKVFSSPESECDFIMPMFAAWMAIILHKREVRRIMKLTEKRKVILETENRKLQSDINSLSIKLGRETKERTEAEAQAALFKKQVEISTTSEMRSRGRLQSKRRIRMKATPIVMKGKKRIAKGK